MSRHRNVAALDVAAAWIRIAAAAAEAPSASPGRASFSPASLCDGEVKPATLNRSVF